MVRVVTCGDVRGEVVLRVICSGLVFTCED